MSGDLPPGCSQRDLDRAYEGRPDDDCIGDDVNDDTRKELDRELREQLISIALSPMEVTALTLDGAEDLMERERRLS